MFFAALIKSSRARMILPPTFRSILLYVRKAAGGEDDAIGDFMKRPHRQQDKI